MEIIAQIEYVACVKILMKTFDVATFPWLFLIQGNSKFG